MAARTHGVEPAQIAKTLSFKVKDRVMLVVTSGTARLNNRKIKDVLGGKPRMLTADEVVAATGHPVGGVCPFGLATPLPVYCDLSLKAFDEVVPAAGSTHSALRISPSRMAELVKAEWVDVKKGAAEGDNIEVMGNLQAGDRVVKHASDELREGAVMK